MLSDLVRVGSFWLLFGTLVLLPFEFVLPDDRVIGGYTLTTVEVACVLALGAWVASLVIERRLPRIPLNVALALFALVAIGFASALLADGLNEPALDVATHAGAGGLLFIAVADTAVRARKEAWLATALVAGATASALVGLAAFAVPSIAGPLGLGEFTTTGVRRLSGTLDYPNSAAMYYEAALLLAIGLGLAGQRRTVAIAAGVAAVILGGAMILTLSRGALIGLCAGLIVLALTSLAGSRETRRRAWLAAAVGSLAVLMLAVPLALSRSDGAVASQPTTRINASYTAPAGVGIAEGTAVVPITITNTGTEAWNDGEGGHYVLGFHWLTPDASRFLGDGAEATPIGPLQPGETKVVSATVNALPPALGYVVAWDVFVPGRLWLSQYGVPVATSQIVSMGRPGEEPLPPPTIPTRLSLYQDLELPPSREELWSAAAAMTAERPLLGHGPGTFQLRYGPYLGLTEGWDTDIHANNTYLEISATTGVLGLAAFLVLVALVLVPLVGRVVRPPRSETRREALFGAAVAAALVAFLAHGAVDYFIGFNPTGGLFWAILGLALVSGRPRTLNLTR